MFCYDFRSACIVMEIALSLERQDCVIFNWSDSHSLDSHSITFDTDILRVFLSAQWLETYQHHGNCVGNGWVWLKRWFYIINYSVQWNLSMLTTCGSIQLHTSYTDGHFTKNSVKIPSALFASLTLHCNIIKFCMNTILVSLFKI